MEQEYSKKDQIVILILGTVRSEKKDFFSRVNSFSLLMVKRKDGRTILNISVWPIFVALAVFLLVRAIRSK